MAGSYLVQSGSLLTTLAALKTWPKVGPLSVVYLMLQDQAAQLQVAFVSQKRKPDLGATFQLSFAEGPCLSHLLPGDGRSH